MKGQPYLCLGQLEISNGNRVSNYVREASIPGLTAGHVSCAALDGDDPFVDQISDPAPWYDANVPASGEFLGLYLTSLDLQPVMKRSAESKVGGGGIIGSLNLGKRIISCQGRIFATTPSGMAFGERWVNAALAGTMCQAGCRADDAEILPACPEVNMSGDYTEFFRQLIDVALIDGPTFAPVKEGISDCMIEHVDFQLASGSPYLYGEKINLADHESVLPTPPFSQLTVLASTNAWPGDGVLVIQIENDSVTETSGEFIIQAHVSFDGTCDNLEGEPCWEVKVDNLLPEEVIIIDAQREDLLLYKPTQKQMYPALSKVVPQGDFFFDWPTVPPCTDLCFEFTSHWGAGHPAKVTVDFYPREF